MSSHYKGTNKPPQKFTSLYNSFLRRLLLTRIQSSTPRFQLILVLPQNVSKCEEKRGWHLLCFVQLTETATFPTSGLITGPGAAWCAANAGSRALFNPPP